MNMKQLRPGELRFIAKLFDQKLKIWGAYDRARACWPISSPEFGTVKQRMKLESEAQEEADRLNAVISVISKEKSSGKQKKQKTTKDSSKKVEQPEAAVQEAAEEPGYEGIDAETAQKYTEGLF